MSAKVSVIITAHNYAKYLPKALDSVLAQNFHDFEVIVVNDGSTDHTTDVLSAYENNEKVKVLTLTGVGLAAACNRGIEKSSGDYLIRLDADDYFDENILLVEATYLDNNPNVGLVFCDYYTIDPHGEIIDRIQRARVNDEVELLDRPALAAGAMYRRKCYEAIGGYNEEIRYQEDYDFWIKFIEKFQVRNVSLPLMYYRQHASSMSRNWSARMETRRKIKEKFVREHRDRFSSKILGVIPARSDLLEGDKLALLELGGKTLLQSAVEKMLGIDLIDRVIVSTEDQGIMDLALQYGAEVPFLRSKASTNPSVPFESVLSDHLRWFREHEDYQPDIVVLLHPHSPFINSEHVVEAIDTMLLFDTDSVLGVVEDLTYHWMVGRHGLTPVGYQKRVVRQDKDLIYKESGGLYVIKAGNLVLDQDLLGRRIGHIEFRPQDAVRIQSAYEYWIAKQIVKEEGH
jgi:glycosyltransferase involved in cell wall biosynthesis/CMP-N-acetylneuraminic acid synthetase